MDKSEELNLFVLLTRKYFHYLKIFTTAVSHKFMLPELVISEPEPL